MKDLDVAPVNYKGKEYVAFYIPKEYLLMAKLDGYEFKVPKDKAEVFSDMIAISAIEHDFRRPS